MYFSCLSRWEQTTDIHISRLLIHTTCKLSYDQYDFPIQKLLCYLIVLRFMHVYRAQSAGLETSVKKDYHRENDVLIQMKKLKITVLKLELLRQHQDLQSPTKTYKDLQRPTKTFQDLPRPTKTYQDLPRPTKAYQGLPRPTKTYKDLPKPTKTYQYLPRPTKALSALPRLTLSQ